MDKLESIGEQIREYLEIKNAARDRALQQTRTIIRYCSKAIRAAHRDEPDVCQEKLQAATDLIVTLKETLAEYPDLFHAGYTRSALKEFVEASIVKALLTDQSLPTPEALDVDCAAYLGGLGEAAGELRRRVLDILRHDEFDEAERLLGYMDEIYGLLVTIDFPDAITDNLRRITDMVRGVTERTRGDLTTSLRQHELKIALESVEKKLGSE
jgi:translin